MANDILQFRANCYHSLPFFAANCLTIRTKSEGLKKLQFNAAQKHIHQMLQRQKKETGKVRAYIVKGRQQGCSTYIAARYYWLATNRIGCKVFILTHLADATDNLFKMVRRMHDNLPAEIKVKTSADSAKELRFSDLESGYAVGTARSAGAGRSETIQLFHGSEVAYWPDADQNAMGVMQAVPSGDGTEIIMESTANGVGNYFYDQVMEAQHAKNGYQLIFVPWFWQHEYSLEADDIEISAAEEELQTMYNLTNQQIAWRRQKVKELGGEWRFAQEYPCTLADAFQNSGRVSFIPVDVIAQARFRNNYPTGAIVLGVDPALSGDRTSFCVRQGAQVRHLESWEGVENFDPTVGRILQLIKDYSVDKVMIDVCGIGYGVHDRLRSMGYGSKLIGVNSATKSLWPDKYVNKRAEMWDQMRRWLEDGGAIPDSDTLAIDLQAPAAGKDSVDFNGRIKIAEKAQIKKEGFRSPDEADALALTFAFPIATPQSEGYNTPQHDQFRHLIAGIY